MSAKRKNPWRCKPRKAGKLRAWLKGRIRVVQKWLDRGFCEAWFQGQHWTVEAQRRSAMSRLGRLQAELSVVEVRR